MKVHLKKELPSKLRALFLYDSEREIDATHPLYNELMLYANQLDELHVFVFIKNPQEKRKVLPLDKNIFVYYIPTHSFILHVRHIWSVIHFHLVWKGKFRPHFVLNFSSNFGANIGLFLAKRYGRKFFAYTTGTFLELRKLSRDYVLNWLWVKSADAVFVSSERVAGMLVTKLGLQNEKVSVIRPWIDLSFLEQKTQYFDYAKKYPQHSVFLLSHLSLGDQSALHFLLRVFKTIVEKYPRIALVIIVPANQMRTMQKIVRGSSYLRSIYLYPESDDVATYYGNAHIFLSPSGSEEASLPLIRALGLHLPAVTTGAGVAKEIFSGSAYEAYVQSFGDVNGFSKAALKLIEDQQVRDSYRVNSPVLLKSLSLQTVQGYVSGVLASIEEEMKQ